MPRKRKGKLIVIDGLDGSGKATQTALLVKKLRQAGHRVKVEDFPQYGKKSAGPVEDYLNERYGGAKELGPYIPSVFYAVDRFAASKRIRESLNKGYIVVSNRYVTSSMGHQGGKIKNKKLKIKYFQWLYNLEYNFFKIPKPDLTLILHMPPRTSLRLVDQKGIRKAYTRKKRDLHTKDLKHMLDAEKAYLELAGRFRYPVIECVKNGKILKREEISNLIWEKVKKIWG